MQKLVLASNNAGKVREFQELLAPFHFQVIPQGDLGIPSAEEPHLTFVENALAKARHASAASSLPALADDSGICAHALNGEPGVFSARYAGLDGDNTANNRKLIEALQGKTDRGAHYVCALVMVNSANDPEPLIVQTRWYGQVIDEPRGNHGFGYDPHFFLPELDSTAAELEPSEKNLISHRGQALRELIAQLQSRV
ncbi:RdgB/HAM1 family non-canonical purine NTP pyrophosphatase [Polynucleobacter sp. AP-Nino-20-G2]|uniref:RdgB/HAM1 family non-canonical purine NTP pyrophosphatase n=1 Tax=Polynucleobacter sp. AP-Nino-20-G2 TaxID=2576917 RepID=UPI001BFE11BB|nr:RdgB/HAM1 family non-canonical purine NTP pyrophosphatase [Polynucleobacter sp. AP-Nino-20-G2]QWE17647.1 RdgB/HAM1 family non-canonical purine NTP pyrophosphatase [Polynucleobacter sp. AP-Nino-20-G2]